jgi:integrase
MAIDSMLRGCDLVKLLVRDICHGDEIQSRAQVIQKKTHKPVQFEITQKTRVAVKNLIDQDGLTFDDYLFKSRQRNSIHLSTRQYLRIVDAWVTSIGLDKVVRSTECSAASDYSTENVVTVGWVDRREPQQSIR